MTAYLDTVKDTGFMPEEIEALDTLLQVFLLEKALSELIYGLNHRPEWVVIPLKGIICMVKNSIEAV